jgi:hypothetical protein
MPALTKDHPTLSVSSDDYSVSVRVHVDPRKVPNPNVAELAPIDLLTPYTKKV